MPVLGGMWPSPVLVALPLRPVQHDVHYIRNWSLGLDLRILARTLTSAWFSKHET